MMPHRPSTPRTFSRQISCLSVSWFAALSLSLAACDEPGDPELADDSVAGAPGAGGPPAFAVGDEGPEIAAAHAYLRRYGYFPNPALAARYPGWSPAIDSDPDDDRQFDLTLEDALAQYQANHGLPVTGELDPATQQLMQQPRCGVPDNYHRPTPTDRAHAHDHAAAPSDQAPVPTTDWTDALDPGAFKAGPTSLPSLELRYAFNTYTGDIGADFQRQAVVAAMATWSASAPVAWVERGSPDVTIAFLPLAHGDGSDFTTEYAHANYPYCDPTYGSFVCDVQVVHFNDQTYKWGAGNGGSIQDIETIALHELGHVLGLDHSSDPQAVMYPTAPMGAVRRKLSADDINGIRTIYPTYRDIRTFEPNWYLFLNTDVLNAYGFDTHAGSRHWLSNGRKEVRRASPGFDVAYYLATHADVAQAYGATNYAEAFWHWRMYGLKEGRRSSQAFHAKYYMDRYPDLQAAFGATNYSAGLKHWLQNGLAEGRRASAEFDPVYYLNANPDVAKAHGATNYAGGLWHWLMAGMKEGRKGAP